jgi:hypothetical protein
VRHHLFVPPLHSIVLERSLKQNMTNRRQYEEEVSYASLLPVSSSFRFFHPDVVSKMTNTAELFPSYPRTAKGQLNQVYVVVVYYDGNRNETLRSTILDKTGRYF